MQHFKTSATLTATLVFYFHFQTFKRSSLSYIDALSIWPIECFQLSNSFSHFKLLLESWLVFSLFRPRVRRRQNLFCVAVSDAMEEIFVVNCDWAASTQFWFMQVFMDRLKIKYIYEIILSLNKVNKQDFNFKCQT